MARTSTRGRKEWVTAAAQALAAGGWDRVKVEPLAKSLGVTKGSFYWHFKNRRELLDAIVQTWAKMGTLGVIEHVDAQSDDPRVRLQILWAKTDADRNDVEIAIRNLAEHDAPTAQAVQRVDEQRFAYLRKNFRALGCTPADAEARGMLMYSLLLGDHFLSEAHGRFSRQAVLKRSIAFLLNP